MTKEQNVQADEQQGTKEQNVQAAEQQGNAQKKKDIRNQKRLSWSRNTTASKKPFQSPVEKLVLTGEWLEISTLRLAERYSRTVVITMPRALRLDDKDLERLMKDSRSIKFGRDEKASYIYLEYDSQADAKMKITQIETMEFSGQKVTADISNETAPCDVNPYILYVDYIPPLATFEDVQAAFPTASHISVKFAYRSDLARKSAILFYEDKNVAGQVFQHADAVEIKNTKVPVTFLKYSEPKEKQKRSRDENTEKGDPNAKKSKVVDEEGKEIQEGGEGKSPKGKKKKKKKRRRGKVTKGKEEEKEVGKEEENKVGKEEEKEEEMEVGKDEEKGEVKQEVKEESI